jgi:hypothetical protein
MLKHHRSRETPQARDSTGCSGPSRSRACRRRAEERAGSNGRCLAGLGIAGSRHLVSQQVTSRPSRRHAQPPESQTGCGFWPGAPDTATHHSVSGAPLRKSVMRSPAPTSCAIRRIRLDCQREALSRQLGVALRPSRCRHPPTCCPISPAEQIGFLTQSLGVLNN